jgi:hypothetical protein
VLRGVPGSGKSSAIRPLTKLAVAISAARALCGERGSVYPVAEVVEDSRPRGAYRLSEARAMTVCSGDFAHHGLEGDGTGGTFPRRHAYCFQLSGLSRAHSNAQAAFVRALERGDAVVVSDNTNTTIKEVTPYLKAASRFGCHTCSIRFDCPTGERFEPLLRLLAARNNHGVPLEACRRMRDRLAPLKDRSVPEVVLPIGGAPEEALAGLPGADEAVDRAVEELQRRRAANPLFRTTLLPPPCLSKGLAAAFLTRNSRQKLLSWVRTMVPGKDDLLEVCDHMTIAFEPTPLQVGALPVGKVICLRPMLIGESSAGLVAVEVQSLAVQECLGALSTQHHLTSEEHSGPPSRWGVAGRQLVTMEGFGPSGVSMNAFPHVTVLKSKSVAAVESNTLLDSVHDAKSAVAASSTAGVRWKDVSPDSAPVLFAVVGLLDGPAGAPSSSTIGSEGELEQFAADQNLSIPRVEMWDTAPFPSPSTLEDLQALEEEEEREAVEGTQTAPVPDWTRSISLTPLEYGLVTDATSILGGALAMAAQRSSRAPTIKQLLETIRSLYVFDFDGTLAQSDSVESAVAHWEASTGRTWPQSKDWVSSVESFLPPSVVLPGPAVAAFRAHCNRPNSAVVVLTARPRAAHQWVEAWLEREGMRPDGIITKPAGTKALEFKITRIRDLASRIPHLKRLDVWEDSPVLIAAEMAAFREPSFLESTGLLASAIHIHDAGGAAITAALASEGGSEGLHVVRVPGGAVLSGISGPPPLVRSLTDAELADAATPSALSRSTSSTAVATRRLELSSFESAVKAFERVAREAIEPGHLVALSEAAALPVDLLSHEASLSPLHVVMAARGRVRLTQVSMSMRRCSDFVFDLWGETVTQVSPFSQSCLPCFIPRFSDAPSAPLAMVSAAGAAGGSDSLGPLPMLQRQDSTSLRATAAKRGRRPVLGFMSGSQHLHRANCDVDLVLLCPPDVSPAQGAVALAAALESRGCQLVRSAPDARIPRLVVQLALTGASSVEVDCCFATVSSETVWHRSVMSAGGEPEPLAPTSRSEAVPAWRDPLPAPMNSPSTAMDVVKRGAFGKMSAAALEGSSLLDGHAAALWAVAPRLSVALTIDYLSDALEQRGCRGTVWHGLRTFHLVSIISKACASNGWKDRSEGTPERVLATALEYGGSMTEDDWRKLCKHWVSVETIHVAMDAFQELRDWLGTSSDEWTAKVLYDALLGSSRSARFPSSLSSEVAVLTLAPQCLSSGSKAYPPASVAAQLSALWAAQFDVASLLPGILREVQSSGHSVRAYNGAPWGALSGVAATMAMTVAHGVAEGDESGTMLNVASSGWEAHGWNPTVAFSLPAEGATRRTLHRAIRAMHSVYTMSKSAGLKMRVRFALGDEED